MLIEIYEITKPNYYTYRVEYSTPDNEDCKLSIDTDSLVKWVVDNELNEVTEVDELHTIDPYTFVEFNYYELIEKFLTEKHQQL